MAELAGSIAVAAAGGGAGGSGLLVCLAISLAFAHRRWRRSLHSKNANESVTKTAWVTTDPSQVYPCVLGDGSDNESDGVGGGGLGIGGMGGGGDRGGGIGGGGMGGGAGGGGGGDGGGGIAIGGGDGSGDGGGDAGGGDGNAHAQMPLKTSSRSVELESELGRGGFATVWRGKWLLTPVAVKVFHNKSLSEKATAKFWLEAKTLRTLRHPNICYFLDTCMVNGSHVIVLE